MDYHYFCAIQRIENKLDEAIALLRSVIKKENRMSKELDDLTVQVKANTDAEQSAVVLLGQLSALITAAGTDPVKLKQLAADLDTSKQALAAAIVANTPATP